MGSRTATPTELYVPGVSRMGWTGLLRQWDSNAPAPYVLDVRRAAAKFLLFAVVVMAWRAMPLASKVDGGPRAGGAQGLQAKPGGGHQAPCESPAAS